MPCAATTESELRACGTCGLVQTVPPLASSERARCPRCHKVVAYPKSMGESSWTTALALTALILYPFAVSLPFMNVSRLGHTTATSILKSSVDLVAHGDALIGAIIFVCSVLLPIGKLAGLLAISTASGWKRRKRATWTWHAIELAGRWGMIDVLLTAILLAMLKLGDLVTVTPGPGLFVFASCVLLSLAASATFDPHTIWKNP